MDLRVFLGIVCVLSVKFTSSEAKWVEGNLQSNSDWEFLSRFCFLSIKGSLVYSFMYPVDFGTQEVLFYSDAASQWDAVYKKNKNCTVKVSVLRPENQQIIALNTSYTLTSRYSGCQFTQRDGQNWYNCTGRRNFRSIQNRRWYIAVARCGKSNGNVTGLKLEYAMNMTNGEPDNQTDEFSYPEQIEMFPSPDRIRYDEGQLLSMRCTGRIGNQFDENNLQNLWTWEWRSVDTEFSSWSRYPNDRNITYDRPTSIAECQYTGASTLVHTVSDQDSGRQFRCSVLSADYSANKTVYVVGQTTPPTGSPGQNTGDAGVDGGMIAGIVVAILVVIAIIIVVIVVMRKKKSGGEH